MTQHLETLKGILQKALNESVEHKDFIEGLEDCTYACSLGVTALTQHFDIWLTVCPIDSEYRKGVQFVAEQWDRILSEDEGEK